MRRGGERDDDGEAAETALDELYVTPPPGFVSRREGLAAEARAARRTADARRIRAARRPSLAAWASNLLLRSRPEETRAFLDLGRALRDAFQSLDAEGIKELSERRRSVVSAMSRQAAELAAEAGHRLSDPVLREVEATLRAVLADQDAADRWATGRLESALTPPSDFPGPSTVRTDRRRSPAGAATASPDARTRARARDEVAERRRQKQEQEQLAQEKRERLAREKQERLAQEKQEQLAREKRERLAQEKRERLAQERRERLGRAREAVRAADGRLRQAREDLRRAERQQRAAEKQRAEAADAVSRAERAARDAASEVERLSGRTP
ncbi:hypothetical protein RM704_16870 [Streptomyces sp. DSM 3412]|uniref:Uncharacterized protein n=1 Tax=Streptomyces gottesmaniae TaxID=3075518 RepID=A0ABU2YXS1_9ACTN|nr:hypothetical protein [Streptomyces sp. DSM 3412]MDT0569125.1 hypothetical protein [Streptomyces sp. DSM 3412]